MVLLQQMSLLEKMMCLKMFVVWLFLEKPKLMMLVVRKFHQNFQNLMIFDVLLSVYHDHAKEAVMKEMAEQDRKENL
jgi:hypothetical protein